MALRMTEPMKVKSLRQWEGRLKRWKMTLRGQEIGILPKPCFWRKITGYNLGPTNRKCPSHTLFYLHSLVLLTKNKHPKNMQVKISVLYSNLRYYWPRQRISMQWVVCKQQAVLKTNEMVCGENLEATGVEREWELVWSVEPWAINCHAFN